MTVWDFLANILTSIIGGGLISFLIGTGSVIFGLWLAWRKFRKSIKRWFNELVKELIKAELEPIKEKLNEHSEEIKDLHTKQTDIDRTIAIQRTEHRNLSSSLRNDVMPDLVRIRTSIDDVRNMLIKSNTKGGE